MQRECVIQPGNPRARAHPNLYCKETRSSTADSFYALRQIYPRSTIPQTFLISFFEEESLLTMLGNIASLNRISMVMRMDQKQVRIILNFFTSFIRQRGYKEDMRNFEFQEGRFQNGLITLKKDEDGRNVFSFIFYLSWHDVNIPTVCKIFFFWFRSLGWVIKVNSQRFCALFICQNDRKCGKQKRVIRRKHEKNMKN